MALTIRELIVQLRQRGGQAVADTLKVIRRNSEATRKSFADLATSVVSDSARMATALRDVAAASRDIRVPRGGGSGGSAPRTGGGAASGGRRASPATSTRNSPVIDDIVSKGARSSAAAGGVQAAARAVTEATAALGRFASASDKVKAKVADLTTQVARNRTEMADLKRQIVLTGDADGTLAARMRGLSAETLTTQQRLASARRELRGLDGGLIDAVKRMTLAKVSVVALGTALGNLASGLASRAFHGVTGAIGDAGKAAIDFDKIIEADLGKLLGGSDDTVEGLARIKQGIKDASTELGVMPDQVAQLTAALAPVFSGKVEADTGIAPDLVALVTDVTKIGKAWDVSGAEAGQFFADASRGLETTSTETKDLFGSINELSNVLGVKAATIATGLTGISGVLKGAGLSGETGSAIVASLVATGNSAEVAATGARTFIRTLEVGRAATPKQRAAFEALGLDAKKVGEEMSKGGKQAEAQIIAVVKALHDLPAADKLPTLIELFGSESIGSVGAVTTSVKALGDAFAISGSDMANFASVEKEYERVNKTTAAGVERLKAQVAVLAIEFGEALLPHIDKVVAFLTSPEGKEWGANAVANAVTVVTNLADILVTVAGGLGTVIDKFGGAEVAVVALGATILALTGPIGVVSAALVAMLALIAKSPEIVGVATGGLEELAAANAAGFGPSQETAAQYKAAGLALPASAFDLEGYRASLAAKGVAGAVRAEDDAALAGAAGGHAYAPELADVQGFTGPALPGAAGGGSAAGGGRAAQEARYAVLAAKVRAGKPLRYNEQRELNSLRKSLNEVRPTRARSGRGRGGHKLTKMDRQLAALDPSLAGVLRGGGEEDAGGDLKVHDDVLSRAAFARSTGGGSGGGGIGAAGPSTTNIGPITIQVGPIDARGNDGAEAAVYRAGERVARTTERTVIVGLEKVRATLHAGGRLGTG